MNAAFGHNLVTLTDALQVHSDPQVLRWKILNCLFLLGFLIGLLELHLRRGY